jgi:sarcinarray family protein
MGIFISLSTIPVGLAADCEYGSLHVQVHTMAGGWENATAHRILKRGESFEIQLTGRTSTEVSMVFVKLHEFGTPVYEVIDGPTQIEQLLEYTGPINAGQQFTYLWKIRVRPNTTWVNGYSPLEIYAQFNKNDTCSCQINFDGLIGFIVNENWDPEPTHIPQNQNSIEDSYQTVPDLPLAWVIILVFLSSIFLRTRRNLG